MRVPTSIRRERAGGERRPTDGAEAERSAGDGRLRTALLAASLLAMGYLLWRRMRSGAPASPPEEAESGALGPDEGRPVPIDGPTDEGTGAERSDETASAVDPSLEEVDERVEADVEETPAEPGEVAVSEDVAEEADEGTPEDESATDSAEGPAEGTGEEAAHEAEGADETEEANETDDVTEE